MENEKAGYQTKRFYFIFLILYFFTMSFVSNVPAFEATGSEQPTPQAESPADRQKLGPAWTASTELIGSYNPLGIDASEGLEYRDSYRYDEHYDAVSAYWQAGGGLDVNPAYVQPSIHLEWMPWIFATARLQYDGYYFFGTNGSLLSFSSGQEPFGDNERRARRGTEESGFGSRVLVQPTILLKVGDIILRNQSDIARYRFPGKGPFFLEQEYDTLLKDGDYLFANRTQVLKEIGGPGQGSIFLGPYYELVHARAADLTRQRIGVLFYSEQSHKNRLLDESHFFAEIGYNLEDRNRERQIFLLIGVGGSSILK
jgi:hypothetical protein